MENVSEYKMVRAGTIPHLEKEVTDLLNKGWILYGNPIIPVFPTGENMFFQALVKGKENNPAFTTTH